MALIKTPTSAMTKYVARPARPRSRRGARAGVFPISGRQMLYVTSSLVAHPSSRGWASFFTYQVLRISDVSRLCSPNSRCTSQIRDGSNQNETDAGRSALPSAALQPWSAAFCQFRSDTLCFLALNFARSPSPVSQLETDSKNYTVVCC